MNAVPSIVDDRDTQDVSNGEAHWGAVYAMTLCVVVLIASEFMPVSLLSPIARDLQLSEGQAGQAIAVSGVFAVTASLLITLLAGERDRRHVLIGMAGLLVLSGLLVAFAPNFEVLMVGRAILGVAIGGFWSMSAATIMRLVPPDSVSKGLGILYGGNAVAAAISAPFGSFAGSLFGWRGAFLCVIPLAVAAVVWTAVALPPLPAGERQRSVNPLRLLRHKVVVIGMAAIMLLFLGQFALFTYLRPFLEQVTHVDVTMLSVMLLTLGIAGFFGTMLISRFLGPRLFLTQAIIPGIMAMIAVALAVFGGSQGTTLVLLAIWGLVSTAAPVGWATWLTITLPDDAEAGGGLLVAAIQMSITFGATAGGIVFDSRGPVATVLTSAVLLVVAMVMTVIAGRVTASAQARHPTPAS